MASVKELRGRIKSVRNIKQITRAMEMVATTKLRRFQERAIASRPYAQEIALLVGNLAALLGEEVADRPLFNRGAGEATALLVVASERGLCGAYNSNLFRRLELWLAEEPARPVRYYVYGKKGYQYLTRRGREAQIARYYVEPPLEKLDFRSAAAVARELVSVFLAGELREVRVLYTAFVSMARYVPTLLSFLPVRADELGAGAMQSGEPILEPDPATIFDRLVPRYLETRVYNALLEALTSEYASRRFAMKNATDAASDMQSALRGIYNRKRQESITKELLDIVGGAEAVK